MRNTLVLFGCGGHSRSVADVYLNEHPGNRLVFVDENARENETIFGFPVIRKIDAELPFFLAIGDNVKRFYMHEKMGSEGLVSVFSSKAHLGGGVVVDSGCFIGNFCHIGPQVQIGLNTIVNHGAIVEHEVRIGSHSHIGPRAVISGRCWIGDLVFVGVGATIKDNVHVCSQVIIGAGGVVVKSIQEPGVYVGCPAAKLKEFPISDLRGNPILK